LLGDHVIDLPKRVVVGRGVLTRIASYIRSVVPEVKGLLVVTGPRVKNLVYKVVHEYLDADGISSWDVVVDKATVEAAEEVSEDANRDRVDAIVGLGGGKAIDVAKYAAVKASKPFISVPTVASHDGITSPFASLKGFEKPTSKPAKPPTLILMDVDVIASAPRRYNIAGFGDIIGKFTAVLDWKLAHKIKGEYFGGYAASLALMSARHVSQHAELIASNSIDGLRVLLEALVSSGVAMCIAGSTRPASGSEHLFAHAVTTLLKNPPLHGELVGVGTIMMSFLHGRNWKKIRKLLKLVGAPTTARELGIPDHIVIEALTKAASIRPERYTILSGGLSEEAARKLAERTMVISGGE